MKLLTVLLTVLISALSLTVSQAKDGSAQLKALADQYTEVTLANAQPYAYFNDIELERHNLFIKNSPSSFAAQVKIEDQLVDSLTHFDASQLQDPRAKVFFTKFKQNLETNVELRVCKSELWNVSHMFGAHSLLDFLVNVQPLATKQNRDDALERWQGAAIYYDQEIANLTRGLKQGYSAPKRVVNRLVAQLNGLTSASIEHHPFLKLATRANNPAFEQQFKKLLQDKLIPAIKRYSDFLATAYLTKARTELGIHAIPNGKACYMAKYRSYTSLKRTPQQVFDLGLKTVNGNKAAVINLGKRIYAVDTFAQAVYKASNDATQKFATAEAMHQFFETVVEKSKGKMQDYFHKVPSIEMVVEAIPKYQQGTGRSAHYISGTPERKAKFAYDPVEYKKENFASGEVVSVHEGYPGHHMQIALVQQQGKFHPIESVFSNAAFSEGWARYAEALSEEAGIYQYGSSKILRRAWPARGMVADTALHILGWSNQQVADFLKESGASFANDPDIMLDRMAAIPAQLTAYDSGALEIFALRKFMQNELGNKFNIKDFHQIILSNGNVPMSVLNEQVKAFVLKEKE